MHETGGQTQGRRKIPRRTVKGDAKHQSCSAGLEGSHFPLELIRDFEREFHSEDVIDYLMCLNKLRRNTYWKIFGG